MNTILIKLSGTVFNLHSNVHDILNPIVTQLAELSQHVRLGIVVGGGNFFRASKEGRLLGLQRGTADTVGMLATMMNGLMLQDLLLQHNVKTTLLSALDAPGVAPSITQESLRKARAENQCIIFSGGTGLSYFSTDTNAIIRALQIDACAVWKATNVDGLYSADPAKNPDATLIKMITPEEVLMQRLAVMDATAITLALQHRVPIRIFNVFKPGNLRTALDREDIGSTIVPQRIKR